MPQSDMTIDEILNAFATAGNVLPRTALQQAASRWIEVAPVLLELLESITNGTDTSERSYCIIFYAIYLMAKMKEPRTFPLLCELALREERIEDAIGDGAIDDLPGIFAHTFNGNQAPLRRLIEAPDAYDFARAGALEALAWLTITGKVNRGETEAYLRELYTTLQPQGDCFVWHGWQAAIAGLAFTSLTPLVEEACQRELINPSITNFQFFLQDIQAAQEKPGHNLSSSVTDEHRFDDLAAYFSSWIGFKFAQNVLPILPLPNKRQTSALRKIGRNDPCHCGSQKKFKKCCLVL